MALIQLRQEMPRATVGKLIEQMQTRGMLNPATTLCPSTVYRLLHEHRLQHPQASADRQKVRGRVRQRPVAKRCDARPAGSGRGQASEGLPDRHHRRSQPTHSHAGFYLNERLSSYVDALEQAVATRGLPRKLYVDNGSAFRCRQLEHICASLGTALIHSKPYTPQGRGKIERFFRTVRAELLTGFKGQSLVELNEVLDLWLEEVYHRRPHGATGQSPFARFSENLHCIRPAPENLNDFFRHSARETGGQGSHGRP